MSKTLDNFYFIAYNTIIPPHRGGVEKTTNKIYRRSIRERIRVSKGKMEKAIDNRLATIEGQVKAVRKMLMEEADCVSVITQLMAVEKAIKKTSVLLLTHHLNHCIVEAEKNGTAAAEIEKFNKILEMYL